MITTKEEAHALCLKFGVNPKKEKYVCVTENGNIYLSENIDKSDIGKKVFELSGEKTPDDVELANAIALEEAERLAQEEADKLKLETEKAEEKTGKKSK